VCLPSWAQRAEEQHSLAGEEVGRPIRTTGKKAWHSVLYTQWLGVSDEIWGGGGESGGARSQGGSGGRNGILRERVMRIKGLKQLKTRRPMRRRQVVFKKKYKKS
jgi:hypothetical protein